jgi:hydroxymethylpyrimidine pyrophosphatase-like HAD family hydrolase
VKLTVLALDYDGTIALNDRFDRSVLDAIATARRQGIAVMLVTGRGLDDLRRVAGDLHFVDRVVAENGALVHFCCSTAAASWPRARESARRRSWDELLRLAEVGAAVSR